MRFPYVCLEHLTLAKRTLTSSQATTGLISLHKHLSQRKQNYFTTGFFSATCTVGKKVGFKDIK